MKTVKNLSRPDFTEMVLLFGIMLIMLSAYSVKSQVIPNYNFENWSNGPDTLPDNWQGRESHHPGFYPITQSTDHYLGNYSVRLENKIAGGDTTRAFLESARPGGAEGFGPAFPVNFRCNTLKGYYKFIPDQGDSAFLAVSITKTGYVNSTGWDNVLAFGWVLLGAAPVWTPFSTSNLSYDDTTGVIPDSAWITITAYNQHDFNTGQELFPLGNSVLYIDALNFDSLPVGSQTVQSSQSFKYQAVARDYAGNILSNQNISFRMSILQGSTAGNIIYVETHGTLTNQFGLVNLEIGNGNVISGVFANINWPEGLYFIQTEMDATGGTNYQLMGTSQLLSVPYSFYSGLSGGLVLTDENGNMHEVKVDTLGILVTEIIWTCGDFFSDTRDGQTYNTVQIGSQCWLAENLNIGTRINGIDVQTDNSIIEKYCYSNLESNCDTYGGLYLWNEMMQYVTTPGAQGICPAGWHFPTDEEWKVLEGTVDSQHSAGDPVWDQTGWRGFDAGLNLKSTSGWDSGGNGTDLYGFSALPGGFRDYNGSFLGMGLDSYFWSSTEYDSNFALDRILTNNNGDVSRNNTNKAHGCSVRCVRD